MRPLILVALLLVSSPAWAGTRTIEIVSDTGFVQAIIYGPVDAPVPDGMTFIVLTNDAVQVQGGWHYDAHTGIFSPPNE